MDDKIFNLLEQMQANMMNQFEKVHGELKDLREGQTKIQMDIEANVKPNIKLCLDELVSVKEKLAEHDLRFDTIDAKIESHDVEISVIKRVK